MCVCFFGGRNSSKAYLVLQIKAVFFPYTSRVPHSIMISFAQLVVLEEADRLLGKQPVFLAPAVSKIKW